ncbi:MAG: ATP-binding protein [Dehalococcoidia bacterium]
MTGQDELRIAEFLITTTYVGFIVLFLFVLGRAARERGRAQLDAALFFGVLAALSVFGLFEGPTRSADPGVLIDLRRLLAMSMPLLLLRLLDGFTPVRALATRLARAGYIVSAPLVVLAGEGVSVALVLPAAYFLFTLAYAAVGFVGFASRSTGVTRRRMQSIGVGTGLLIFVAVLSTVAQFVVLQDVVVEGIASVASLSTACAYYLGIAPPAALRRTWQYGALTDVLRLLATTPASMPLRQSVPLLNEGIAHAFGAPNAAVLLWDDAQQALVSPGERVEDYPEYHPQSALVTRVFESQRAQFFDDAPALDPANAALYARMHSYSLLAAPIRTAAGPVGVLTLYSPRASVFSSDDIPFTETVSEQVSAFFVRHELVQQAVTMEAQEEAMRLKEDFLAAAAHDLRTPLTGILGRAQLLLRRAVRDPEATPSRIEDLRSLVEDGKRMQRLTEGLLEVSRLEHGFTADREPTDLHVLARDVVDSLAEHRQSIDVVGEARAAVDAERFRQVLQNLVDNAVKFTPGGGAILVEIEDLDDLVRVSVTDSGLGLATDEVNTIFERFQRGSAATRGLMGGMGVGLYLCRRIVQEHGGTIRAERRPEGGARFIVELPQPDEEPETMRLGAPATAGDEPRDARASARFAPSGS